MGKHVITIASSWPIAERERCKMVVICIPSVWIELLWIVEISRVPTHGIDWYHNQHLGERRQ